MAGVRCAGLRRLPALNAVAAGERRWPAGRRALLRLSGHGRTGTEIRHTPERWVLAAGGTSRVRAHHGKSHLARAGGAIGSDIGRGEMKVWLYCRSEEGRG